MDSNEGTEEEEEEDDQPSVVVKEATPKPASNKSPLANLSQTIRQRFSGSSSAEKPKSDRFTPTPRFVMFLNCFYVGGGGHFEKN